MPDGELPPVTDTAIPTFVPAETPVVVPPVVTRPVIVASLRPNEIGLADACCPAVRVTYGTDNGVYPGFVTTT
jgi:hypothetical protein